METLPTTTAEVQKLIEDTLPTPEHFEQFVTKRYPSLCSKLDGSLAHQQNWLVLYAYNAKILDRLAEDLREEGRSSDTTHSEEITPNWGRLVQPTIDAAISTELARMDPVADIRVALDNRDVLPMSYAYIGNSGFKNWIDLTEDNSYRFYQDAKRFYEQHSDGIAETILSHLHKARPDSQGLDFISLGPGDGTKDAFLICALVAAMPKDEWTICYYPFDINWRMVACASSRVQKFLGEENKKVLVKGIVSEFKDAVRLRPIYRYRNVPNVFSLLGNTLGNMARDKEFLESLFEWCMSDGDVLLLEVRTVSGGFANRETLTGKERTRKFFCGPLQWLGCDYDSQGCLEIKGPKTGLSQIRDAETLVTEVSSMKYKGNTYKGVKLYYIHHYRLQSLREVVQEIGFEVAAVFPEDDKAAFGILVLVKP